MKTKAQYKTKERNFLTKPYQPPVPTKVWIQAMIAAQKTACQAVRDITSGIEKVELFWVTYNFEIRQNMEGAIKQHAKLKT